MTHPTSDYFDDIDEAAMDRAWARVAAENAAGQTPEEIAADMVKDVPEDWKRAAMAQDIAAMLNGFAAANQESDPSGEDAEYRYVGSIHMDMESDLEVFEEGPALTGMAIEAVLDFDEIGSGAGFGFRDVQWCFKAYADLAGFVGLLRGHFRGYALAELDAGKTYFEAFRATTADNADTPDTGWSYRIDLGGDIENAPALPDQEPAELR